MGIHTLNIWCLVPTAADCFVSNIHTPDFNSRERNVLLLGCLCRFHRADPRVSSTIIHLAKCRALPLSFVKMVVTGFT